MKNLSKDFRALLEDKFDIARPKIIEEQISNDGTCKWLMQFPSGGAGKPVEVETVYIPEEGRGTLCVSSQVGCTLTCTFCHTGTQKLVRNLTSGEVLAQLLVIDLGIFLMRTHHKGRLFQVKVVRFLILS
jgi:23S rRNA (adenine2503-C2)-methyltransferase